MSGQIRQKTFVELVNQRTPASARSDLQVYSSTQVDSAISAAVSGVDLSAYTPLSTTASISGNLNTEINNLETTVTNISGALAQDISDLDLSLTVAIDTLFDTTTTSASAGSYSIPASAAGFVTIYINNQPYKLAYFNP